MKKGVAAREETKARRENDFKKKTENNPLNPPFVKRLFALTDVATYLSDTAISWICGVTTGLNQDISSFILLLYRFIFQFFVSVDIDNCGFQLIYGPEN